MTHRATLLTLGLAATLVAGLYTSPPASASPQAASARDWENPQLLGIHRLPPHATMVICPDARTACSIAWADNANRVKSPWYRALNGAWKSSAGPTAPISKTRTSGA